MCSTHMPKQLSPVKCNLSQLMHNTKASCAGHMQADVTVTEPHDLKNTNYNCVVSIAVAIGSRKQSEE